MSPSKSDLNEQYRALHFTMAESGLDGTGHKRAAELLLSIYGDEFTEHDLAAALVHATLATGAPARLETGLAEARQALESAADEILAADSKRAVLEAALDNAHGKLGHADATRHRAQVEAVRKLCGALRQEGLAGVARRIEGVLSETDGACVAPSRDADDPFAGLNDDEPTPDTTPVGPHETRLLAGACRCGGAIDRGQLGDEPWRHTATAETKCQPGDAGSPDAEPVIDRAEQGAQFDAVWKVERGVQRVADECVNCGGGVYRGQFDDGPWQHYTEARCDEAIPKSFTDLIDTRVVVGMAGGQRAHGVLSRIADSRVFLHPCEDGPAEIPLIEVNLIAALPPRADAGIWRKDETGRLVNTLTTDHPHQRRRGGL